METPTVPSLLAPFAVETLTITLLPAIELPSVVSLAVELEAPSVTSLLAIKLPHDNSPSSAFNTC